MALAGLPPSLSDKLHEAPPRLRKFQQKVLQPPEKGAPQPFAPVAANLGNVRIVACETQLQAIHALIENLSNAGHALQRDIVKIHADSGLQKGVDATEPLISQVSLGFLKTCHKLGGTLVSFTAKLSDEALNSLKEMQRKMEEDIACKCENFENLDQQEMQCYKLVKDCAIRKEEATHELKKVLDEWGQSQECAKSESTIKHAASVQLAVVEELAPLMSHARLALEGKEKSIDVFNELLCQVDTRCISLLQTVIGHCSSIWEGASHSLQTLLKQLNNSASAAALTNTIQEQSNGFGRVAPPVHHLNYNSSSCAPDVQPNSNKPAISVSAGTDVVVGIEADEDAGVDLQVRPLQEFFAEGIEAARFDMATTNVKDQSVHNRNIQKPQKEDCKAVDGVVEPSSALSIDCPVVSASLQPDSSIPRQATANDIDNPALEPANVAPGTIVCRFGDDVKRLGFEVLWEDDAPSVGNVVTGGATDLCGIMSGDILVEINGTCTHKKTREVLMPLLTVRPLELKFDSTQRMST